MRKLLLKPSVGLLGAILNVNRGCVAYNITFGCCCDRVPRVPHARACEHDRKKMTVERLGMRAFGYACVWVRVRLYTRAFGYACVWIRVRLDTRVFGYASVWVRERLGTRVFGYASVWVRECLGTRVKVHECACKYA